MNFIRTAFLDKRPQKLANRSLHSLLAGFLTFMAEEFDPNVHALSIRNPGTVLIDREDYIESKKVQFRANETVLKKFVSKLPNSVYIVEDPLNPGYNPAGHVKKQ